MQSWRVGVDSGGTFTDVCLFDMDARRLHVWKVPSTPADPSEAIAEGLEKGLTQYGGDIAAVGYLGHGTTVATNALIQGRGALTALITTEGFRDLLEIARQKRPSLYDLQCDKPVPVVPRRLRLEVRERLRHDGRIETPLDEEEVRQAARTLKSAGVQSVAIAFLYSYVDSRHEVRAREIVLEEMPDAFVSCSHEVSPEFREFERFSTVAVNAALGPIMSGYVHRLGERIDRLGLKTRAHITQSNGGVISFDTAASQPVRTVLSGPSTGVVGAIALGALADAPEIITFDMGGTSTDVALIEGGRAARSSEQSIHGHPLKIPMLDINTVGAGGGSIARIDVGGLLKVGPESAGANPGPACYGLGSAAATVTDANVALGILNPTHLLDGRMPIDRSLAIASISDLGEKLGLSWEDSAQGILEIVTSNMAKAIRVISVQRGYDPRRFTLMAFGGAGPIHAARLARELETPRILVPLHPGILCATGLLLTDLVTDYSRTRLILLDDAAMIAGSEFDQLQEDAEEWFALEGVAPEDQQLMRSIDMRYAGQNYELSVAFPDDLSGDGLITELKGRFEAEHLRMYGYIAEEEPVQLVTFRLQAKGLVQKMDISQHNPATSSVTDAIIGHRSVWLPEAGGWTETALFSREALGPGHTFSGPAIVTQMDSTTLILPGQTATVDPWLNLVIVEAAS